MGYQRKRERETMTKFAQISPVFFQTFPVRHKVPATSVTTSAVARSWGRESWHDCQFTDLFSLGCHIVLHLGRSIRSLYLDRIEST
jgi:hypothetical protein